MGRLSRPGAKRLLALTIIAIFSYSLGVLTHSEILHYFAQLLGLE